MIHCHSQRGTNAEEQIEVSQAQKSMIAAQDGGNINKQAQNVPK